MGGRTKEVAENIASELEGDVRIEGLDFEGSVKDFMGNQEDMMKGNLSKVTYNKEIEDLAPYDLIIFGTPTYGMRPTASLIGFLEHINNIKGKDIILFATCRFLAGKVLQRFEKPINELGGNVLDGKVFKGLFRINMSKARDFGIHINKEYIQK